MALLEVLSEVGIFEGLDQAELSEIAALCREVAFEEGAPIFCESDEGTELYILLEGTVRIEMEMPLNLKESEKLAIIKRGEVFGEMCFVGNPRRSATARAVGRTRTLVIERDPLTRLFEQNPRMGYVVMRHLAEVLGRRLESTDFMWRNAVVGQKGDTPL